MAEPGDDAGMGIDDQGGSGPENINVEASQDGVTYDVGVHYWNDC